LKAKAAMSQYYEIRVKGHLDLSWSDWFDGLTISHQANGETVLAGMLTDQAALQGVLRKISDLGIALISVNPADDTSPTGEQDSDKSC
jgi:hypothetical protein